jgi:hypothetical protein
MPSSTEELEFNVEGACYTDELTGYLCPRLELANSYELVADVAPCGTGNC